jgi:16S rRNA (cytosine967-C5)-methyltransferase
MSKDAGTSSPRKRKNSSAEPRGLAATVLMRVWHDAAWAAPTLDAELSRAASLDDRDKRLATEIVYGVLRTRRTLEKAISRFANNNRWRTQEIVHVRLCIAAYELMFLDKIPVFATVSEAVDAIKAEKGRGVGGFANAVLRKLAAAEIRPNMQDAIADAIPSWLQAALADVLGGDGARAFATARVPPPLCICLRDGEDRDVWIERLASEVPKAQVTASEYAPCGVLLYGAGNHRKLPGADGAWTVQEEGAQVVALAVGASARDTVLDACAGRGGKSLRLAEVAAFVDAADLHPKKLERLVGGPHGRRVRSTYAIDWTRGVGDVPADYDRVLVDAPCSGSGTLRRRPEIANRLAAHDVARLAALQLEITRNAATRVRPGGRLIYAVCSVLRDECEGVVQALLKADPQLQPAPFDNTALAGIVSSESSFRLLPHIHGTDGYFVASFVRRE